MSLGCFTNLDTHCCIREDTMRWAYVLLPAKDTKIFIKREDLDDLICHLGKLRILSPLNVSNINTQNTKVISVG